MGKYFGTDGFRGEAGIDLTADHAYKVGRFLGWYYNMLRERNGNNEPARIVIGKDTRRSSYMFEYSLVAGLTASGADAYLLHVTTTPSVAYIARVDDFDCGIMISASHNPYYDNGIKLIDCYGEKMPEETLLLVEDYIDGKLHVFDQDWPELPFAHREHIGCTVDYVAGRNRYMGYLISLGIYSFKGIKVGLDCANGASWNIAKSVFDALGADTYVINNQPNGLNINLNAGSTHIEGLQKAEMAEVTNLDHKAGSLADMLVGADVFIGVSAPNTVTTEMVKTMNKDAIIFACANPTPEIFPDAAKAGGAKVISTGRSDYPNQINNVLAFPGIFRGAFDVRASDINEEMKVAAAEALAALVGDQLSEDYIIPAAFDPRVGSAVAKAVAEAARKSGVARIKISIYHNS